MFLQKKTFFIFLFVFFLGFTFFTSEGTMAATCDANIEGKTNQELQAISDQCDREIAEQKTILQNTQKYSSELEKGVAELNYKINTSLLEIKAKNAKIKQLGENIVSKAEHIGELSERMENIKKSIAKMIRGVNNADNISMIEILLSKDSISTFLKEIDNYASINEKLRELILELSGVKKTSEEQKKDLENKQKLEEKLKYELETNKRQSENFKKEKESILKIAKGQEDLYKKAIAEKERLKNQIKNRIFKTVGGEELTFGEALKLVQPYESTIGVSPALVLAVLTQESSVDGLIGKNLGKCYYNQTASNSNGTVMSRSQVPSFLAILSELGLNPNTTPVSCPIYSDGQYGGAMGPAQFMPNTWWNITENTGYKNRVVSVVGSDLPSPFNNRDAFVGTALYLKDAQTRCKTAFSKKWDIWACSASKYYGGLALKGTSLSKHMYNTYGYGRQVADRAVQFERDIDTLNL